MDVQSTRGALLTAGAMKRCSLGLGSTELGELLVLDRFRQSHRIDHAPSEPISMQVRLHGPICRSLNTPSDITRIAQVNSMVKICAQSCRALPAFVEVKAARFTPAVSVRWQYSDRSDFSACASILQVGRRRRDFGLQATGFRIRASGDRLQDEGPSPEARSSAPGARVRETFALHPPHRVCWMSVKPAPSTGGLPLISGFPGESIPKCPGLTG